MDLLKIDNNLVQTLPKVYELLDNFNDCTKEQHAYCNAIVKLHPSHGYENSPLWTAIRETKLDYRYYSRDRLYRGFCVPKTNLTSPEAIHNYYSSRFDNNYSYSEFEFIVCPSDRGKTPQMYDKFDIFVGLLILGYVGLIMFATVLDYFSSKKKHEVKPSLRAISLFNNWKKIFSKSNNISNTAALQFFRVISMVVVIAVHSFMSSASSFIRNTEDVERIYHVPFVVYVVNIASVIVSIYFLISSFLLSIQILEIYDSNSRFTMKDLLITALNRYLRLIVLVLLPIMVFFSTFCHELVTEITGVNTACIDLEYKICTRNWWKSLLLIHNNSLSACYRISWYAGAEMQLSCISLVVLYLVLKMKNHAYKIFGFFVVLSVILQWTILYFSKIDAPNINAIPDNFNFYSMWIAKELVLTYSSTMANLTSYLIGLTGGYFYHHYKDLNLEKRKNSNKIWIFSSSLVIAAALISSGQSYSPTKITTYLVSAILKPMFVLGNAILILGLLFNVNRGARLFCEQRIFQILAKFNYSMYIFHFIPITLRFATFKEYTVISKYSLAFWTVMDLVMALIVAFIIHILVELPAGNLQKIFVPQVKKLSKRTYKNE